ncbi:DASH complex subunit ask1 [Coniosporium apollinis]|uniref:DASH complex subunit ASK1 n=1 Tax=Coniosporium apollinis TaxID=61459 RepID=A0ABQ9NWX5_9PEZI|nr:DASH complex subunit ask1 [Coniosporium apollinis]
MSAASRGLTLTEELEKLEQSITLTLQEIDHNFSRAHRIVTTSILPIVEEYVKHSAAVWDGSKFWKQFFEASANVSLTGYEEADPDESAAHDETATTTQQDDEDDSYTSPQTGADETLTPAKPSEYDVGDEDDDTALLSSPSVAHAHSTPRMPTTSTKSKHSAAPPTATFAEYPSPYETLKRELRTSAAADTASSPLAPSPPTPAKQSQAPREAEAATPARGGGVLPDMTMTPDAASSPFVPVSTARRNPDPLLHRMLDKTFRIAATPHSTRQTRRPGFVPGSAARKGVGQTPGTADRTRRWTFDSSPASSPAVAAPQLRAEIFGSPLKGPRTPGVSVQTPRYRGRDDGAGERSVGPVWDSESDGEEEEGMFSPPKTMQFHVPQSRLLQTPAREASKRIVQDLLLTAGAGDTTDELQTGDEDSPSVVRRNVELDDSF